MHFAHYALLEVSFPQQAKWIQTFLFPEKKSFHFLRMLRPFLQQVAHEKTKISAHGLENRSLARFHDQNLTQPFALQSDGETLLLLSEYNLQMNRIDSDDPQIHS